MDIVYVLGKDYANSFNEFRYSLRSAEKNLQFDNLYIIGVKPTFISDKAIHIPITDNAGHKYKNVARKIKFITQKGLISEDFIYMNDDFFVLKKVRNYPYFYNKKISDWVENYPFDRGKYYHNIVELHRHFPDGKFFEVHCPIVYNKAMLKRVIDKYNLEITIMLRSYYCNEYLDELSPVRKTKDYKVYENWEWLAMKDAPFVSTTNASAASTEFKSFMASRFPQKSSFEK